MKRQEYMRVICRVVLYLISIMHMRDLGLPKRIRLTAKKAYLWNGMTRLANLKAVLNLQLST
jgi:hypothetical protein